MLPVTACGIFTFLAASYHSASMTKPSNRSLLSSPPTNRRRSARIQYNAKVNDAKSDDSCPEELEPISAKKTIKRRKLDTSDLSETKGALSSTMMPPLLNLGKLVQGTLVKRPSAAIRSPYVADVSLLYHGKNKKEAPPALSVLAHAPSLDVGGMCVAGSEVYLSERSGEGKTSHSIELVRSGAPLSKPSPSGASDNGVLVGAHPRLGELIAEEVLKLGLLKDSLPLKNGFELGTVDEIHVSSPKKSPKKRKSPSKSTHDTDGTKTQQILPIMKGNSTDVVPKTITNLRRQVTLGDSRVDFQMTLTNPINDSSHRIIFEVKNVVCGDYELGTQPTPTGPGHCVVVAPSTTSADGKEAPYQRSAIFPWGRTRGQKFEGRSVVSERACKHLKNLQSLIADDVTPVVLFIVNRPDCQSIRACQEKCPVFAEVLEEVVKAGVKALAVRVRWTEDGECFYDGIVPVKV